MSTNPVEGGPPAEKPFAAPASQAPPSGMPQSEESPFRKMFGGMMSPQQFTQFINEFLKQMIAQFKQSDAGWKQAMDEMKKAIEGED